MTSDRRDKGSHRIPIKFADADDEIRSAEKKSDDMAREDSDNEVDELSTGTDESLTEENLFSATDVEPVGFVVDVVDPDSERLRQVELEQPVVADHLERHALAGVREGDAAVGRVLGEAERGELLHHRARGGGGDVLAPCQGRGRDPLAFGAELVDLLQVVLDRVAQVRVRHQGSVGPLVASPTC